MVMMIRDGLAEGRVAEWAPLGLGDRRAMIRVSSGSITTAFIAVVMSACGAGRTGKSASHASAPSVAASGPQTESCDRPEFAPESTTGAPRATAHAAFHRARVCFEKGEYEVAAAHFEAANKAFPHPSAAFNIALSYDWAGTLSLAVDAYEEFLRVSKPGEDTEFARERIEFLRKGLPGGCTVSERLGGVKCPPLRRFP